MGVLGGSANLNTHESTEVMPAITELIAERRTCPVHLEATPNSNDSLAWSYPDWAATAARSPYSTTAAQHSLSCCRPAPTLVSRAGAARWPASPLAHRLHSPDPEQLCDLLLITAHSRIIL